MVKKGLEELEQFHLTRGDYAKRLGITPNAVRMRMRHGNLSGEFRFDGNKYLFKSPKGPRDNIVRDHPDLTTHKKKYNRGNHFKANYPNDVFKLHNEMKMLNKIKGKFKNEAHEREFNQINEAGLEKAYKESRKVLDNTKLNEVKDYGAMLSPLGLRRVEEKGYYGIRRMRDIDTSFKPIQKPASPPTTGRGVMHSTQWKDLYPKEPDEYDTYDADKKKDFQYY
jgi:hypothetical protein